MNLKRNNGFVESKDFYGKYKAPDAIDIEEQGSGKKFKLTNKKEEKKDDSPV